MKCPACGNRRPDLRDARYCPGCGFEILEKPDPLLGKVLGGRFRITGLLADGGMGRVYSAEQEMGTTLRRVAIKTLHQEASKSEQQMARFLRECSLVSELSHPNTIKFYDYGETDDHDLFIAMEFVDGESLAAILLGDSPMAPPRLDRIVGQICGSIQEAHDKGIVHRDLKPENILVASPAGEEDFIRVLDFGIAKRLSGDDPKLTPLGLVLGSPAYMSPEQFVNGPIDGRSDIYSLGIVCFEALTGQLPFQAKDIMDWPVLHRNAQPLPFEALGVEVPASMRRAILHALAKQPEARPASMRDFYAEFTIGTPRRTGIASGRPADSSPEPPPTPPMTPMLDLTPAAPAARSTPAAAAPPPERTPAPRATTLAATAVMTATAPAKPKPPLAPTAEMAEFVPATAREQVPPTEPSAVDAPATPVPVEAPASGNRMWLLLFALLLAMAASAVVTVLLVMRQRDKGDERPPAATTTATSTATPRPPRKAPSAHPTTPRKR